MFYWIYDLPALWVIVLFEAVFVGVFWLGAIFLRRLAGSWLKEEPRLNEMLAAFFQYFGLIYGLLLGLLAVATYQNRLDVEKSNANEAASLSALYRNITAYPEPTRTELQNLLRAHTRYLIEEAWPQQRMGIVPVDESHRITALQARLALFDPQSKAQELLHQNTLRQFNTFYEDRRARIYSLTSGIPPILWYTVAVGVLINVRPPPACPLYTWRTYLVLPWHHHFGDCPHGSPLPRRARPVTRCFSTDLPSGDETVASGMCQSRRAPLPASSISTSSSLKPPPRPRSGARSTHARSDASPCCSPATMQPRSPGRFYMPTRASTSRAWCYTEGVPR